MIIAWWSAGVTSAVATKLAIDEYGKDNVLPIYFEIDSAHPDNVRFKTKCEEWYGRPIEVSRSPKHRDQFDVIINGREFTPVESGTTTEAWDGFDDQNKWLAQPIVRGGLIERMERVSFGGTGQTLTVDNDNDGILDGICILSG